MKKLKLYLVSREVRAKDVKQAALAKGTVYRIELAHERFQPDEEEQTTREVGFKAAGTTK